MPNPAIDIFAFDETFFNDASFLESLHEINATLQTCPERLCSQGSGEDIKVAALLKAAQAHHQALNGNDIASYELRKQAHLYMRRAKRKLGEPPLVLSLIHI